MANAANDEDQAALWAIRLDNGPLATEDQAALATWLAADERRAGTLLRAEAALVYLDRGRALGRLDEAPATAPRFTRRTLLVGGGIGGAAIAAGLVGIITTNSREAFSTAVGEIRRLPLADGSVATVNTASRIAVAMQPRRRDVALEEGEAWFQVAHDAARPFIVEAGDVRIRAVGTAFSVRRLAGGVDVLVTEGAVETWRIDGRTKRVRIARGQRSFVANDASAIVAVAAAPEIERALAWRTGELALNGEPLSYAVAELNRYNRRKIVVTDPAIGRTPIVGYFRTDEPADFARAVASLVGARVEVKDEAIHLVAVGA